MIEFTEEIVVCNFRRKYSNWYCE